MAGLSFTADLLTRPPLGNWDVETTLRHFAIVSYAVPTDRVRPLVHPSFDLDSFTALDGTDVVWVSMVPFADQDFRFHALGGLRLQFGQTNYRTYVIERATGNRAVWFFGTTLDSISVAVPRYIWQLPWHHGRIRFDCELDQTGTRYTRYRMATSSRWAPVDLRLEDTGTPVAELSGIEDFEAGLVALTHPLTGVFFRRDGHLGTYRVWHDRLACTAGRVIQARIGLFDRLGLVPFAEQAAPHSVLIQPQTEFTIYLPPGRIS